MPPTYVASGTVINDRLIEPGSLRIGPGRVSVDVRTPWYRAVPASAESLRCELNGRERRLEELPDLLDESWSRRTR
jgi:hypothetical protein